MSDYISREMLLDMFEDEEIDVCESYSDRYSKWGFSYKTVRKVVKNAPSADVAPVVHGRWISWEEAGNFVPLPDRHECSVCHDAAQALVNGFELLSDYCPNCGAKMDEKAVTL